MIELTLAIAVPEALAGGGGENGGGGQGDKPSVIVRSVVAPSIPAGLQLANTTVGRNLVASHNKALIFGKEAAEQGLVGYFPLLTRSRQYRHDVPVLVADGRAADVLSAKTPLEANAPQFLFKMERVARQIGYYPRTDVYQLLTDRESRGREMMLSIVRVDKLDSLKSSREGEEQPSGQEKSDGGQEGTNEQKVGENDGLQLLGAAVFKSDRMVAELGMIETQMVQLLEGALQAPTILVIPDPTSTNEQKEQGKISVEVRQERRPHIRVMQVEPQPHLHVTIVLDGEIIDQSRAEQGAFTPEGLATVERSLEQVITKQMNDVVARLQQIGSDVIGFGDALRIRMKTEKQWEDYRWFERFHEAKIDIEVQVFIRRTGMVI